MTMVMVMVMIMMIMMMTTIMMMMVQHLAGLTVLCKVLKKVSRWS